MKEDLETLAGLVRDCRLCADRLPLGPRPVLQVDPRARILVAGQAPGSRVHDSGDLPPISLCAQTWRQRLLDQLVNVELTLVIGQYAQKWHLPKIGKNLTLTVQAWESYGPQLLPLPHPSPRNNPWLKKNPWFEETVIPMLRRRVEEAC